MIALLCLFSPLLIPFFLTSPVFLLPLLDINMWVVFPWDCILACLLKRHFSKALNLLLMQYLVILDDHGNHVPSWFTSLCWKYGAKFCIAICIFSNTSEFKMMICHFHIRAELYFLVFWAYKAYIIGRSYTYVRIAWRSWCRHSQCNLIYEVRSIVTSKLQFTYSFSFFNFAP